MTGLCDLSATEQAALIRDGKLSARELLAESLARIEATNTDVNAVVTLDAEGAERAAAAADEAFAAGRLLGPLHGLTLGVKDLHATAGLRTTYGSPVLANNVPDADELLVERERAAGAIIVGKTNTPEFGAGSHTFNRVFGVTRNPYALDRSAGGSSGGSAAALTCGMVSLADGSDMGGSLRNPASFCNVVGHRPSPGRVPTWPVQDPWFTLASQGPMGRTVADAALLLSVQAGPDPRAVMSLADPGSIFTAPLPTRLDGMRIALSPDLGGAVVVDPEVGAAVEAQEATLTKLGANVVHDCLDFTGAREVFTTLRTLNYVLMFGELVDRAPDMVKQTIRTNVEQGRALTGPEVAHASALRGALYNRALAFFGEYDALVLPACQALPFDADLEYPTSVAGVEMPDYLGWMQAAIQVSVTECPATAVPVAFSEEGLPIGVQVVAPHRQDFRALGIAHAIEQVTHAGDRRPGLVTS
ncbi:amidase [Antrihabitans stalactiti]|uniref:Amidase n=1 Tax=Antrihabitans stalactiti TaxID=2584121 RepID=A0A848KHN5_9NOCA|nr:amidase [Antrihabitans stalactiti]NMN96574.1 amidase [Antrihabitans stalactiti]